MSKSCTLRNPFSTNKRGAADPADDCSSELNQDIEYAFKLFDRRKVGFITLRDAKAALRAFGVNAKKSDVAAWLEHFVDYSEDMEIGLEVFEKLVKLKLKDKTPGDEVKHTFEVLDVDGQGKIDFQTLKRVVRHLETQMSDEELKEMITEFDLDGDGAIDESEFMRIMSETDNY